jgi:hypothetical protein
VGADARLEANHVDDPGYPVTGLHAADLAAYLADGSAYVPAEPDRIGQAGQPAHRPRKHPDVDRVDRCCGNADSNIGGPELGRGDFLEHRRGAAGVCE